MVDLHFPSAGSLKAKRKELSSLKGRLQARLGVSVAEVEHQDTWQRARLACALVSGSVAELDRAASRLEELVLARHPEGASFERHVVSLADLQGGVS